MSRDAVDRALGHYPVNVMLKGQKYLVRTMTADDGPALMLFARGLPAHDTLFMRRDITQQPGIDMWLKDLATGVIYSLIAEDEVGVAGYSTVNLNELEWTRHVADLRVATAARARTRGLGRLLAREAFNIALALDIEKLFASMTPDQEGARILFQELGFQPEALLKDHVKDRDGNYHDLLLKACSVRAFLAQRAAYGVEA
jgi:L-amino acid N-acyltransferase YncA